MTKPPQDPTPAASGVEYAPLSARLRPGIECAPWVIEAVKKLESLAAQPAPGVGDNRITIGATRHYVADDEWFRELTVGGIMFLAPLDQQDAARHFLSTKLPTTRPAESVAQGGEALFLSVASKLDHGPGEFDPNATETTHTAQCRCGLFVQIATPTPTPATGSGGEA